MDVSNGIATLGVNITQTGVDPTAQSLDRLAVSADKAEGSTKRLTETNDGLTVSQRAVLAMTDQQRQAYEKFLGVTTQATASNGAVTKSLYDSRAITLQHAQALDLLNNRYEDNRSIVLQHMEALKLNEIATTGAAQATGVHGLNLGRVNMELGTAAGRILGVNTAASRFIAMLGGSLNGYTQMIALTAAVVALGIVYEKFTEQARKAKEEQEKLTGALHKWHEELAVGAERAKQVASAQKDLADQQHRLADLQEKLAKPEFSNTRNLSGANDLRKQIADARAKIMVDEADIAAGQADLTKQRSADFFAQQQQDAAALAEIIKFHSKNAKARAAALKQLQIDQALYKQYATLPATPENDERLAKIVATIKTLDEALNPKEKAPGGGHAVNETVAALDRQLTEMRKVDEEAKIANVQREYELKLVGMVGYAKDVLLAQERAELATLKARHDLFGIALNEALAMIQADKDADLAKAKLVRTLQEELDTRKMLNDITKDVTAIGKRNEAEAKAEIDAAARKIKDAQDYQDKLDIIWRNGLERIFTNGTKSYQNFFQDLLKTFSQAMDAMKAHADANNTTPGASYKALGVASSAIGGVLAGYDIGHSTGSYVMGAIGGAASGAELGATVAGPWGAVIGGAVGLAAGLFGASRAAKEAAAALDQLKQLQLQQTLAAWKASITGLASDQRLANELDLKYKYLSIRQTIEQVEAGKKMEDQRNKDLQEADDLYKQAQAKLTDSTNALTNSMLNAVAGYKYQAAIFGAADVHAAPGAPVPSAPPTTAPASGGGGGYTGGTQADGSLTVKVVLGDGSVLGTAVLADFKRRAARKGLNTSQWSQIS